MGRVQIGEMQHLGSSHPHSISSREAQLIGNLGLHTRSATAAGLSDLSTSSNWAPTSERTGVDSSFTNVLLEIQDATQSALAGSAALTGLKDDAMSRACCNALLATYQRAPEDSAVQVHRSLALLATMREYATISGMYRCLIT
jgi:hypothetical protein